jgi:hypothetical protein
VSVHTGACRRAGVDELPRSDTPTPTVVITHRMRLDGAPSGYDIFLNFLNFLNREDGCEKVVLST